MVAVGCHLGISLLNNLTEFLLPASFCTENNFLLFQKVHGLHIFIGTLGGALTTSAYAADKVNNLTVQLEESCL